MSTRPSGVDVIDSVFSFVEIPGNRLWAIGSIYGDSSEYNTYIITTDPTPDLTPTGPKLPSVFTLDGKLFPICLIPLANNAKTLIIKHNDVVYYDWIGEAFVGLTTQDFGLPGNYTIK